MGLSIERVLRAIESSRERVKILQSYGDDAEIRILLEDEQTVLLALKSQLVSEYSEMSKQELEQECLRLSVKARIVFGSLQHDLDIRVGDVTNRDQMGESYEMCVGRIREIERMKSVIKNLQEEYSM